MQICVLKFHKNDHDFYLASYEIGEETNQKTTDQILAQEENLAIGVRPNWGGGYGLG